MNLAKYDVGNNMYTGTAFDQECSNTGYGNGIGVIQHYVIVLTLTGDAGHH